ncbi:MAG: HDIG domain-containing protein [Spirochaetaceae bacterium]|nr:HDIG domain-containing protein [Spirochaetaceae bacterium]
MRNKKFVFFEAITPSEGEATTNERFLLVFFTISILIVMLVMPMFIARKLMSSNTITANLQVKELAPEDLFVKRAFEYENVDKTNELRAEAIKRVYPRFEFDKDATLSSYDKLNTFIHLFSVSSASILAERFVGLSEDELLFFKSQYVASSDIQKQEFGTWIEQVGKKIIENGYANTNEINKVSNEGYSIFVVQGDVTSLYNRNNKQITNKVDVADIITKDKISAFVEKQLKNHSITDSVYDVEFISVVLKGLLNPNVLYDELATQAVLSEAFNSVPPQNVYVAAGQKILVKDSIISEDDLALLKQVESHKSLYSTPQILAREILIILITLISYYLFFTSNKNSIRRIQFTMVYLVIMVITLIITTVILVLRDNFNSTVLGPLLPIVLGSMLLKNITGYKRYGYLFTIQYALFGALFPGATWFTFFYLATIGISFINIIDYEKDRLISNLSVLKAIGLALAMTILLYAIQGYPFVKLSSSLVTIIANSLLCLILEKFTLPYIDNFLNIPTIFRLRELEKLNSPLLEKLKNNANGTFNHSLGVADLSVAAAKSIGADENLCKVAALYHDVGKMDRPEYFTENQMPGINKHDDLSPAMSAAMIRSHVKSSVEKCREEGLPLEIITIIGEHHGNDIISYFYNEAVKDSQDTNYAVNETDFSYTGNSPTSRESAIVMLSDCAEAASHSIKDITPQKISRMVSNIIKVKFDHNQLRDSRLDLTELNIIKNSIETSLMGKYHTRIAYPDQEKTLKGNDGK